MVTRALLIATIATGLSAAAFAPQASADPVGGAIVGGAIGAAVGGPPGAAVGAILGTAIGSDAYYNGPYRAYGPAPYYGEGYSAPAPAYAPPPGAYYAPAPVYYGPRVTPVYYGPRVAPAYYGPRVAPGYFAPRVVYARPPYRYGSHRYYYDRRF